VILENGETHHLFLKPLDETEARNYEIIKALDPALAQFMPEIYGKADIRGKRYLVMENTRMDGDGNALVQLADIKLAGLLETKDFNPIANQAEMRNTRGKNKNWFDYLQMKWGANQSPHFMIPKGPKLLRLFNYSHSEESLQQSLDNVNLSQLRKLQETLMQLYITLKSSPLAFAGLSIILVEQKNGQIRPLFIDPAHMQVQPTIMQQQALASRFTTDNLAKIFFGSEADYQDYKSSNNIAMLSIISSISPYFPKDKPKKEQRERYHWVCPC
jgi:hypothetical protein